MGSGRKNATTNSRDQGIPLHCPAQGCLIGKNQEEQGEHQFQGPMLKVLTRWLSMTARRPTSSVFPSHPGSRSRTSSVKHKWAPLESFERADLWLLFIPVLYYK